MPALRQLVSRHLTGNDIMVIEIKADKTDTQSFEMTGRCPFGGDRIGGSFGVAGNRAA